MKKSIFPYLPLLLAVLACTGNPDRFEQAGRQPDIYPDYIGVTVPSTIAPLNFDIDGAEKVIAFVEGADGKTVKTSGKSANFPVKAWHRLLDASRGGTVKVTACGKFDGKWERFDPFEIHVSEDAIDFGIAYRPIAPGYQSFSHIGIYERDLSSFDEVCLIGGRNFDGCVNCHSFNRTRPEFFSLHVRGERGATFIMKDGKTAAYDMKTDSTLAACVYPSWHPDGRFIAYSTNINRQGFHQRPDKVLEVYDLKSDLQVYDTEKNELITSPEVKVDGVNENMPAFSADGRAIYFTSCTEQEIPRNVTEVRYNLCRVYFNPETGDIGHKVDTLVFAEATGKSVSFPKPSYDGRWIMYQLADYGCFGAWHHESDLWLLDLQTGETRPLDGVNSDDAESAHSWSSNSRWFVFGSRRDDGLHTRAYICHIDADGVCAKPFMLPQKSPRDYYDSSFRSYNVPEFVAGKVDFNGVDAVRLYNSDNRTKVGFRWSDSSL